MFYGQGGARQPSDKLRHLEQRARSIFVGCDDHVSPPICPLATLGLQHLERLDQQRMLSCPERRLHRINAALQLVATLWFAGAAGRNQS